MLQNEREEREPSTVFPSGSSLAHGVTLSSLELCFLVCFIQKERQLPPFEGVV